MSGDAGDLRVSSGPADGPPPKFDLDPKYEDRSMGDPSKYTDEVQIAFHASALMRDHKTSEAVRYLVTMEHEYAEQHPHDQNRFWSTIIHDLTSDECYNQSFSSLQQVAKQDFHINLSENTPPTGSMYQAILDPPKGGTDGTKVVPDHDGTLRVPSLHEHAQAPEQAPEQPPKEPTKVLPHSEQFPWSV